MTTTKLLSKISKGWDNMASAPKAVELLSRFGFTSQFSVEAIKLTIGDKAKQDSFKILDVATGTGTLSLFASNLFRNSEITATDFSPKMISILDQIIKEDKIKNIKTKVEDGMNMKDYNENTFDYVYSMFGLIYFPDRVKGLKEMNRVLKPNGKVAIGAWQKNQYLATLLSESYKQLMGVDLPIEQPIISLSNKDQFKKELEDAGFRNIEIHSITKYNKESKQYVDLLNFGNPPVDDVYNIIPDNKKKEFEKLFIELAIKKFPRKNENELIKLDAPAFIGIAEK